MRQQSLQLWEARWPHFNGASGSSAALCGEQEQLLDELLAEQLAQLVDERGAISFPPLLNMSEARRHALLRRWIAQQGGEMPSREALKRITDEVMHSREDANPCLSFASFSLRRYRQQLFWLRPQPSLSQHSLTWHDRRQALQLPDGLGTLQSNTETACLRQPNQDESINIRFQAQGYHHLLGRAGGREMKKLWQELGVPPWQRERIPLIYYNQTLISAPGIFITREGAASDEQGWQAVWLQQQ